VSSLRELGRKAFSEGRNVTQALREHLGTDHNPPEAIEIAYDLQAGSYTAFAEEKPDYVRAYAEQLAKMLEPHLRDGDSLLDAGTGEMTTITHVVLALKTQLQSIHGTDISKRRIAVGREYAKKHGVHICGTIAELGKLPYANRSFDVVTTNHAMEPNGGREYDILAELLRVTKRKLVLFEPCYELASDEGKARMREHGYVQNLSRHARWMGAKVESITPLAMVHNPLNPTACLVISPRSRVLDRALGVGAALICLTLLVAAIWQAG
jgi:SAM-dependent methyltransferase